LTKHLKLTQVTIVPKCILLFMEATHNWGLQGESKNRLFPYIEPDEATKILLADGLNLQHFSDVAYTPYHLQTHPPEQQGRAQPGH